MGKLIDETGNVHGKLKVLYRDPAPHTKPYWVCECECGNILSVYGTNLRNGTTTQCKQCGYKQASNTRNKNLYAKIKGKHFNRITVLEEDLSKGNKAGEARYWKCKCDCGKIFSIPSTKILNETVYSCGCFKSKGEIKIYDCLTSNKIFFEKEKTFETCRFPNTQRLARFDFYLPQYNCIIEFDGRQHYENPGGFFSNEEIQNIKIRDNFKNDWCLRNHIHLIRVPYYDEDKITLEYFKERGLRI